MKKSLLAVTTVSSLMFALAAHADAPVANQPNAMSNQNPITTTNTSTGTDYSNQNTQATTGTNVMDDASKLAAKSKLAPQAITIQTGLMTALDQVKGLKAQMDASKSVGNTQTAQNTQSSGMTHFYQMHVKKIDNELKQVDQVATRFDNQLKNYPSIASSSDAKSFETAFNDLKSSNSTWQSQASNSSYWSNPDQVKSDLDQFQTRIQGALDKAKGISSQFSLANLG